LGSIKPNTDTNIWMGCLFCFIKLEGSVFQKLGCPVFVCLAMKIQLQFVFRRSGLWNAYSCIHGGYDANAKTIFDGLYNFYKAHPSSLTAIHGMAQGLPVTTLTVLMRHDGDMDIAYALLLADKQWGSSGTINILQAANNIINAIMSSKINPVKFQPCLGIG